MYFLSVNVKIIRALNVLYYRACTCILPLSFLGCQQQQRLSHYHLFEGTRVARSPDQHCCRQSHGPRAGLGGWCWWDILGSGPIPILISHFILIVDTCDILLCWWCKKSAWLPTVWWWFMPLLIITFCRSVVNYSEIYHYGFNFYMHIKLSRNSCGFIWYYSLTVERQRFIAVDYAIPHLFIVNFIVIFLEIK